MHQVEYERRSRTVVVAKKSGPSKATEAIHVLMSLGWTSENFADIAAGLKKQERANANRPLRKIITPKSNQG
jgi:hypothetical protein